MVEEDLPSEEPPRPAAEPTLPPTAADAEAAASSGKLAAAPAKAKSDGVQTVRAIEPVHGRYQDLIDAWHERRKALREQDLPRARAAQGGLLALKTELGIENLDDFAAAEIRASARALEARAPGDAIACAELAVALAPDLAVAHVALARARFANEAGQVMEALKDLGAGVSAAAREPRTFSATRSSLRWSPSSARPSSCSGCSFCGACSSCCTTSTTCPWSGSRHRYRPAFSRS